MSNKISITNYELCGIVFAHKKSANLEGVTFERNLNWHVACIPLLSYETRLAR